MTGGVDGFSDRVGGRSQLIGAQHHPRAGLLGQCRRSRRFFRRAKACHDCAKSGAGVARSDDRSTTAEGANGLRTPVRRSSSGIGLEFIGNRSLVRDGTLFACVCDMHPSLDRGSDLPLGPDDATLIDDPHHPRQREMRALVEAERARMAEEAAR